MIALALSTFSFAADQELRPVSEQTDEGVKLGILMSYMLAEKQGVPDAIRAGFSAALPLHRADSGLRVYVEPGVLLGYSERDFWSIRAGANVEGAWWFDAAKTQVYLSTGVHFFRSYTDEETRVGALWRAGTGVRFAAGGNGFVGFEPIAIERLPNGPGTMTPIRTRWGYEITFLQAGVWL